METKENYYSMETIKVQEYLWNALMQYIRWNSHALYSIYGIAWVQLLSIKTNRAEHNRFSWFMFAHNNKAIQLGSPAWVTFWNWHSKSPTESSLPHKHAYITLTILPFSLHTHDLIIGTDVFYSRVVSLCRRDTWYMMICGCNGGNKNFTGAPLWWMRCCHGNTMVKLPAVHPTLTAYLRIFKRQLSLCSLKKIGSWGGRGVERESNKLKVA